MLTHVQKKTQDAARRLSRLGRYVGQGMVLKERGVFTYTREEPGTLQVKCIPREGRVWLHPVPGDKPELSPGEGLSALLLFEAHILEVAKAKAREEVINELVDRKLRRLMRSKARIK